MTSLIPWLDAAYAPTPAEAQQAFTEGYRECGYYLPNIPNSDPLNTWNVDQVNLLRQVGMKPVPIVVPKPDLSGDPVATANAAFSQAKAFGHSPKTAILYDGPHLVNTGKITGPVWLPLPGNPPSAIGAGSAIQWGQENIAGWSVDRDSAAPDFPADAGIVCDFEHAILGYRTVDQAVAWYQAFQNRIAQLAAADAATPTATPAAAATVGVTPPSGSGPYLVRLTTDAAGNGWLETSIPWSIAQAATLEKGFPPVDGYWPGTAGMQDRDENVCVIVTGYLPHSLATVFIAWK